MKIMKTREQEIEIYRSYLETKGNNNYTVNDVCKKLGVARGNLYIIVKRIDKGNEIQLKKCISKSKMDCIWRYRYQQRAFVIEDYSGDKYRSLLKGIIKDMHKDGFGIRETGRLLCKSSMLIVNYLKK